MLSPLVSFVVREGRLLFYEEAFFLFPKLPHASLYLLRILCIARTERDGTCAETRFRLSSKRASPFKSVGASVQSTAGNRGARISLSNAGYTTFGDGVRVLATHSIRQFPLHFPSRASPCATRFRTSSTNSRSSVDCISALAHLYALFVKSAVSPHASTRRPLDGFSWNFILETFLILCWENQNLIKIGPKNRPIYMKT